MAATRTNQVYPCLLDRLTDDAPQQRQEASSHRVFTPERVRAAVLRDLEWLLNCHGRLHPNDRQTWPELVGTTIDYGVEDVTGRNLRDEDLSDLEVVLSAAIRSFEPRIDPATVRVTLRRLEAGAESTFGVEINGMLRLRHMEEEIVFRTYLDAETGRFRVED